MRLKKLKEKTVPHQSENINKSIEINFQNQMQVLLLQEILQFKIVLWVKSKACLGLTQVDGNM